MTTQTPSPDLTAIKGKQQQTWASGDFAAALELAGVAQQGAE